MTNNDRFQILVVCGGEQQDDQQSTKTSLHPQNWKSCTTLETKQKWPTTSRLLFIVRPSARFLIGYHSVPQDSSQHMLSFLQN